MRKESPNLLWFSIQQPYLTSNLYLFQKSNIYGCPNTPFYLPLNEVEDPSLQPPSSSLFSLFGLTLSSLSLCSFFFSFTAADAEWKGEEEAFHPLVNAHLAKFPIHSPKLMLFPLFGPLSLWSFNSKPLITLFPKSNSYF